MTTRDSLWRYTGTPELWKVMIHPSGNGSVGGRPRPAQKTRTSCSHFKNTPIVGIMTRQIKAVKPTELWKEPLSAEGAGEHPLSTRQPVPATRHLPCVALHSMLALVCLGLNPSWAAGSCLPCSMLHPQAESSMWCVEEPETVGPKPQLLPPQR